MLARDSTCLIVLKFLTMKTLFKELSYDELKSIQGGNWIWEAVKFVGQALLGDIISNPKASVDDYKAGRDAADRQWGKK